jgi:hypothetical protein
MEAYVKTLTILFSTRIIAPIAYLGHARNRATLKEHQDT